MAGLITVLALLGLSIWVLPPTLVQSQLSKNANITDTDRLKAINDVRGALLTAIGVLAVSSGSLVAYLNFRGTLELNRRGQVTDRFGKAIDQLGKGDQLDVRIGGIYALEQIARDSEDLHWPVVEVLTAFIREHTNPDAGPEPSGGQPRRNHHDKIDRMAAEYAVRGLVTAPGALRQSTWYFSQSNPKVEDYLVVGPDYQRRWPADVQAALTVLGRRVSSQDLGRLDLGNANLQGADLTGANLAGADLYGASLEGANLIRANLAGTDLYQANLQRAGLYEASLEGANLYQADVQRAILEGANLKDANFYKTNLQYAILGKANLQGANLREANLVSAWLGEAYLRDANFLEASVQGALLSGANLQGANLLGANLQGARLLGANLQGARLSGANLQGVDLGGANLQGANLIGANLAGSDLSGANLKEAIFESDEGRAAQGLTWAQLSNAQSVNQASLPAYLRQGPHDVPEASAETPERD